MTPKRPSAEEKRLPNVHEPLRSQLLQAADEVAKWPLHRQRELWAWARESSAQRKAGTGRGK